MSKLLEELEQKFSNLDKRIDAKKAYLNNDYENEQNNSLNKILDKSKYFLTFYQFTKFHLQLTKNMDNFIPAS